MDVPAGTDDIEGIVDTYSDMVLRIAYHNVKILEDAEDITQEVFLKLIFSGKEFKSPKHEKAWLIRVTVNKCRDFFKSAQRKDLPLAADTEAAGTETSSTEVLDAVMRLPKKYGNVIYLYYYEGFTVPEIARALQRKKSTVSSWLCRAREQLRNSLSGGFDDE